ncbi:DNA topoisomerase 2-binding protein 1-A isoform X2 [Sesamum indicum]|uniref:DNA topoisomerase 2-binding protein 1-A isoform X2 n=1 Tax=Sesamum indicum TaxID=4182 RepID=A0A6I9TX46_SESIN|nr:DNA topoisomerase 2-binding protein 1-A isoform X2 [Sesamum indicum]
MATKVFKGANVFMSRNLVPPELFDALHDALKLNGAQVLLCCDPSRNGPNDYHVIASHDHEKFEDLRAKGCKLIGPQCVLSCAKEHRVLPNQGFTCCLAMDGVNILASGFEKDEKAEIAKMVTAMGGVLVTKASSDVSFVIVKNVLAQKYKWALNNLKKPIVTTNWLLQCWKEHRVVPQDCYRVLPFSGLTICVSGIPADERKEMEKLVMQNGGKYSAELTKRCTHLVCDAPEGDKYKVAKRWGHIYIVTRKWFHQSVARRACLSEESYPVQGSTISSLSTLKTVEQHSQGKVIRNSQHTSSSMATASDSETNFSAQDMGPDFENPLPNIYPAFFEAPSLPKEDNDPPADMQKNDPNFARCIADDSQSEDDDLYLSECRILLVGFEASELRKLVDMVRRGGGSRYMSFSEKLTHVIVGKPSELEIKEVRSVAAFGVIYVVKTAWLEECTFKKKEVPVLKSHIAYDLLLPKDPVIFNKATATNMNSAKQMKSSASQPMDDNILENKSSQCEVVIEEAKPKVQSGVSNGKHMKSSAVFKGKLFGFSSTFPEEQRPEIVLWVHEGGGEVIVDQQVNNVHFTVERHGVPHLTHTFRSTYVTTHWIHSCLQDGCLLDVSSHILYSPLTCQIPLPGFEGFRLCVSRYDMRERQLLRNLCYVLGVKFVEKLTKKVTHLLCKFADGDKFEAACRWGIHVVTAEWIYECAMKNKVVDLKGFYPKELTSQDREAGLYFVSQYPTQSVRMTSGDDASQCLSQLQDQSNMQRVASTGCMARYKDNDSSNGSKRARLLGNDSIKHPLSFVSAADNSVNRKNPTENNVTECTREPSVVPDVAAAIEDLLEQTSKIQDRKSQETSGCHENFLSSNSTMLGQRHADGQSDPGPSKHWMNRLEKRDDNPSADAAARGFYDGFSETQTDSQVVGYEEDLSGRQMIIDRVRTRSSMA